MKRLLILIVLYFVVDAGVFGQGVPAETRGLRLKCDRAAPGYVLFAPMASNTTYLVDLDGQVVRTWTSAFRPSAWVYFLDNGHVLRGGSDRGLSSFGGGGQGGRFQEFDLDGNLVWDFQFNQTRLPHHDVAVLPNGNILAIVWEGKTVDEARQAGRRDDAISSTGVWPDMLIEFEPQRPGSARIVWEWHMWDHLIQHIDPSLDNYADPAQRPERIDINGDAASGGLFSRDIFHTNAVAYNPELDQILLSVPTFNEVWVIDHSASAQEAAGSTGGRSGKGGDLLYRWGNPQAYGRGTADNQLLGFQHDARWIPQGRPGAGRMTVFSNQTPSPAGPYSKVYEFDAPVDGDGRYSIPDTTPFGPETPVWTYSDSALQATNLSGAERLESGNTLISSGPQGRIFEVTPFGTVVWEYWSPYSDSSSSTVNAFSLFRAVKIRPDHPGLAGRDLSPLDPQPAISPFAVVDTSSVEAQCLFPPPTLTSVSPGIGARGTESALEVTLTGTNFAEPLKLEAGNDITVIDVQVIDSQTASARLTISPEASLGSVNLSVSTAGGTSGAVAFTIADPFPDLSIVSSHTANFGVGFDETYTVTVRNEGTASTGGSITVTDSLPLGFTFVSGEGAGWSFSSSGQFVTCSTSIVLNPHDSSQYTLTVAVDDLAAPAVSHSVVVETGGDLNTVNDRVSDPTTVVTPSPVFVFEPYPLVPGHQATVQVEMATPFPHTVTGSIELTFASNAVIPADDPAIQFASGGRTVSFTIPANEAHAGFGSASERGPLAFQPGTVAGSLKFSGTLTAGTVTRTFSSEGQNGLTIPLALLSIQSIETSMQDGFSVLVQLFSTAREVTQLRLTFNTSPRVSLNCGTSDACSATGNMMTLDVGTLFAVWFGGETAFGGLAELRLPFSIEGGTVKGTVALTLRNSKGESDSQSFALP